MIKPKIIKAKDRKPSNAEMVFDWLLETGGIAKGFNAGAQRIEITLEDNGIEYLISEHLHGQSKLAFFCSNTDRCPAIKHLAYRQAEIPREPKQSLTASFRQMVSDTKADIQKRHTSELQAFMGIS